MLVRTQGGYANLATISTADLHDDGGITLHWGAQTQHYEGEDAAALRAGLERLTAGTAPPRENGRQAAADEHEPPRQRQSEEDAARPILLLHSDRNRRPARAAEMPVPNAPAANPLEALNDVEFDDDEAPLESALSRRVDLVKSFEPLASLSHKHRGAFLAAVAKASDFNHLPPKYRRMIQDAESQRRADLRK